MDSKPNPKDPSDPPVCCLNCEYLRDDRLSGWNHDYKCTSLNKLLGAEITAIYFMAENINRKAPCKYYKKVVKWGEGDLEINM